MEILLIGDDEEARKRLKSSLNGQGLEVCEAGSAAEAALSGDESPRLIVAGIGRAGEETLRVCRRIREKAAPGSVFTIAVAAAEDGIPERQEGAAPAADDILREPVAEEELAIAVHTGMRLLTLEAKLKEAEEKIRALSVNDPLTGCYNRSYLNEHLPHEIKRARRYGRSLSVIFCDIDRLDAINSVWGAGMGDRVLMELARVLQTATRRHIDWTARNQEDGFAIVLPETDVEGAFSLAERLQGRINSHRWDKEADLRVTVSFGIAGFAGQWKAAATVTAEDLVGRAQQYLRSAQRLGLNGIDGGSIGAGSNQGDNP